LFVERVESLLFCRDFLWDDVFPQIEFAHTGTFFVQGFARIVLGSFNVAIGFGEFDILDEVVAKFGSERCCSETVWDCFFSVDLK
jgi:hypothetical protein